MNRRKHLCIVCTILLLLCVVSMTALAHDVPDMDREGDITVTMKYEGKSVSGGTLTLYQVGVVAEDDGNYSFTLANAFVPTGASLSDITSAELPGIFANYVKQKGMKGRTLTIDNNGNVVFDKVLPGLYLVVQNTAAKGYNKANPFLVSLPYMENGAYVYSVDASPKVELKKAPETPPTTPPGRLPQTGQLNWPIPVLVITGMLLFMAGWVLRFRKVQ